jgi:hypothetical protein
MIHLYVIYNVTSPNNALSHGAKINPYDVRQLAAGCYGLEVETSAVMQGYAGPVFARKHDQAAKVKYIKQKRMRRREQSLLLSQLDRLLPTEARKGGFKGCGHRSPGLLGRSVLNVLSDAIEHVKDLRARSMLKETSSNRAPRSEALLQARQPPDYREGSTRFCLPIAESES